MLQGFYERMSWYDRGFKMRQVLKIVLATRTPFISLAHTLNDVESLFSHRTYRRSVVGASSLSQKVVRTYLCIVLLSLTGSCWTEGHSAPYFWYTISLIVCRRVRLDRQLLPRGAFISQTHHSSLIQVVQ